MANPGDATSNDCPERFDVVINGKGYMLLKSLEPSLPFRTHRAVYSYTPTFLERTNISLTYGDNNQDFFLTAAQNDWSLGEDQRFYRVSDVDSVRRYWAGTNVDVTVPGQVTIRPAITTNISFSSSVTGSAVCNNLAFTGDATNLYEVSSNGTVTNRGAHSLGGSPASITTDGTYLYLVFNNKLQRYDTTAHTFTSFAATTTENNENIAFSNNTMYGVGSGFDQFDTSGNPTNLFPWKTANGSNVGGTKIVAYGGQLALLRTNFSGASTELWMGDSTGAKKVAEFPASFQGCGMAQALGIIFVIGYEQNGLTGSRTAVYYYANGNLGKLWSSPKWGARVTWGSVNLAIYPWQDGCLFTDYQSQALKYYNVATGGVSTVGPWTLGAGLFSSTAYMSAGPQFGLITQQNNKNGLLFFDQTSLASSATVQSSLFDFDNSLTKVFRSLKVDFSSFAGDSGSTVDLAYQVDSVDGSYTTLQTNATTGTEYLLPTNTTGHSLSVQVTLNKGSSTSGPILKRVYVRAAPQLQSYRNGTYILDLSGIGVDDNVILNDGMPHPLSGHEQAENLRTAIQSATPIQVSDRFCNMRTSLNGSTTTDSFTAACEPADCEIYDTRTGSDNSQYPGAFVAKITVREV